MSKLFYDHLVILDEVEKEIDKIASSIEEKEELWRIVDEIVHHKVLGCLLDNLPKTYHTEFLNKFHKSPFDSSLVDYLNEKIKGNIEDLIRDEIGNLAYELLTEIQGKSKNKS